MNETIRKGDEVEVLRGGSRGKKAKVIAVDRARDLVLLQGLNMKKRHSKPTAKMKQGGIIEKEAPIHVSNLRLVKSEKTKKDGK